MSYDGVLLIGRRGKVDKYRRIWIISNKWSIVMIYWTYVYLRKAIQYTYQMLCFVDRASLYIIL